MKKPNLEQVQLSICAHDAQWDIAKAYRNKYFFKPQNIQDPYRWTFNHKDHKHFILYKEIDPIGYAHIQLWPEDRAAIRIIVIDETKCTQGYGREFMRLIEKWLESEGYKSVHAESSPEALKFYEKLGYACMPFNDSDGYEGGPDDVAVGKML